MTDIYMCTNCGIKVASGEGSECPGCGHLSSTTAPMSQDLKLNSGPASLSFTSTISKLGSDYPWVENHLAECRAMYNGTETDEEQNRILLEIASKTRAILINAPNSESEYRMSSFLSDVYRISKRFKDAYHFGVKGVESQSQHFRNQSHNSILDSLKNLELDVNVETWLQRAHEDGFPEANYYSMNHSEKTGKYEEAIQYCEAYYSPDFDAMNYHKANILLRANRRDESELILVKMLAGGPKNEYFAASINTLAYSILTPQGRLAEAERFLVTAICTPIERERVNAFSNLAMVALLLKEFAAAKRYASIGAKSNDPAIASESLLTLSLIEFQRLQALESTIEEDWEALIKTIIHNMQNLDFDDAAKFLQLLIDSAVMIKTATQVADLVEAQFSSLMHHDDWEKNQEVREHLQLLRAEILSKHYLETRKYLELDSLFIEVIEQFKDNNFASLLAYLRTPFAAIELRRTALKIQNMAFLSEWATFEESSEILFGLAKVQQEIVLLPLAENPASPSAVLELILSQHDLDLDYALSNRSKLTESMIKSLSQSPFDSVRKQIAQRSDCAEHIYNGLATDRSVLVRDAIKENPVCSSEIAALAALGSL